MKIFKYYAGNAGSTSPEVLSQLKKYVLIALRENRIPKNEAFQLLYELSL